MGVSRGIPAILEDLQLVKPTVLFSVPTLYKKIFDGVHNMMETASPIRKRLMKAALEMGRQKVNADLGVRPPLGAVERLKFNVLESLVLSKIRDRFGGRMRHGFVAGAACPAEVLDFMDSIGVPVCEGYGLTETSPIITLNTPENRLVGSVGRPIGGVTVYIVDEDGREVPTGGEGEICCVGPNVMRGYYKNEQATADVITTAPDGVSRMFHTGDLGRMTEDGFIKVTGRLKEQYKLENGCVKLPSVADSRTYISSSHPAFLFFFAAV
jgi:long-chain acyl-CoA synthetase